MMKNTMLKKLMALLLAVAMLCSLAACGSEKTPVAEDAPAAEAGDGTTTITVLLNTYTPMLRKLAAAYMEQNEGINIEIITDATCDAVSMAQLAQAGAMPDVFFVDNLYATVVNDWSIDLTPYFEADPRTENYVDYYRELMTYNGKLNGICTLLYGNCLLVNTDMLNAYNLDIPDYDWTIDEYVQLVKDCKVVGQSCGTHLAQDLLRYFPAQYDTSLDWESFDLETYSFRFDDAWVQSVNKIKEISDAKASLTESIDQLGREWMIEDAEEADAVMATRLAWLQENVGTIEDPWPTGHLGTVLYGSWMLPTMEDSALWSDFEWDIYPMPVANEGDVSRPVYMVEFASVSTACPEEERQAAYDFLSWLYLSVEAYQMAADYITNYSQMDAIAENQDLSYETIAATLTLGYVPAVKGEEYTEILYNANPELAEMEGYRWMFDNIDQGYCDLVRIVPGFSEAYTYHINEALILSVYSGKKTAADVAKEVEALCNNEVQTRLEEMGGK